MTFLLTVFLLISVIFFFKLVRWVAPLIPGSGSLQCKQYADFISFVVLIGKRYISTLKRIK
ncbi:hypothetical protein I79_025871 [Cricetulus griseus]|uniref:Uncharacterized protein n=1 Tax=Cricetulus griseus TaxID=10029 RepID=G3IPG2_CRIGR|nr:hypothetical protein I79_025871 [Cricetulus griseus]